jgi:anaerobic magnesium-protoporphyrin IX monomethyl ester cyclase
MNNHALITHSYFYPLDNKQWKFKQPYPPLGTLFAAAVIRALDIAVSFSDSNLQSSPSYIFPELKKRPKYFIIYDDGFNYLTKMCLTAMREAAFKMIAEAKNQGCIIVVNSSDASDHYEKYLSYGADYIIRGEGEETLKDLLLHLESKKDISTIAGIVFSDRSKAIITPPRSILKDLDSLPSPAWELIDIEPYRKIWRANHGYFSLNIATTRGCPFKCNWCAKPIYGNRYNSHSPENVVNEIESLLKYYQPDHFWMCDDIFGLKPGWVNQFGNELKKRNLKIKYKIQSRADLLVQEDTVEALAASGAKSVWLGAESGSQKILDAMDKGTTLDQIEKATQLLKRKQIKVGFFLQFGYLEETIEDINATLKMVLNLMPDEIGISVSYPLPGTGFYNKVKNQMNKKQNWTDSDDLAMMFEGTYGSSFYKTLHRYVHNRYRIQRGWNSLKDWIKDPFHIPLRSIVSMLYHLPISYFNRMQLKRLQVTND